MLGLSMRRELETAKSVAKKDPGTLFAGCPIPEFAKNSEVVARITQIHKDRGELVRAKANTTAKIEESKREVERLDTERVERLADLARLHAQGKTDSDPSVNSLVESTSNAREAAEALRRAMADDERVLEALDGRAKAFDAELVTLRLQYTQEIGKLLDAMYAHLADEYMAKAPALSELLRQIAGVQEAMMHFRSGNSNGFDRRGYIPRIEPGSSVALKPFIDCSQGLAEEAEPTRREIIDCLGAIGYKWRFEG